MLRLIRTIFNIKHIAVFWAYVHNKSIFTCYCTYMQCVPVLFCIIACIIAKKNNAIPRKFCQPTLPHHIPHSSIMQS